MNQTKLSTKILRLLGIVFAIAVCGDAFTQAFVHLRDLTQINHIVGIWMTLAQSLREGVFYPPLEQDGYYAGTRYMPLFFVLIAGLAKLTGDYLLAAKLASLLSMLGLLAVVFAAARRITGCVLDAIILASVVLVFPEGRRALLWPHADALAVAFSLAGLLLIDRRGPVAASFQLAEYSGKLKTCPHKPGKLLLSIAALLFSLALATKISSAAGCAAACVFLFWQQKKSALGLVVLTAALVVTGFGLIQLSSEGRFLENFRAVGSGGLSLGSLKDGPVRLMQALILSAQMNAVTPWLFPLTATPLLLTPAAFLVIRNALERRLSLWDWYFLFVLAGTLFIFMSPGTDVNHLLELEVASVLVLAGWLRRPAEDTSENTPFPVAGRCLVGVTLIAGLVIAGKSWMQGPPPDAIAPQELTEALPPGQLLTEDATVAVLRGQRPVVMDAFAYRLLVESGRVDPVPLAERIRRHEFAKLVLLRRIEDPAESLAPRLHFGTQVTDAIVNSYRFERPIGAYYLYVPK